MSKDISVRKEEFKAAVIKQLKSLIGPFIILAIIIAGILVITFWKEDVEEAEVIKVNGYEGEGGEVVLENDQLKFVMDETTTQFSITDKSSKKVWYSNPEDVDSDSKALDNEKSKLKSTLLLTYSTINGVDTLFNNYSYSIEDGIYGIEKGDDYVKVNYSIGDTEKEYIIPTVITLDKMDKLLANMSKSDATRVGEYYKKYDINKLGKKDNKEELLANYPILETEKAYILRRTTKDNIKVKLEQYFADAGYTMEDYKADKELDMTSKSSDKPVFNVNVVYRLEGNSLVVEVPMAEIEYREDYPVYNLSVLPYFGAAGTDEEGYMLVPEGGGALINFNNGKTTQNSYYANLYGWDMAQDRKAVVHETEAYFNVFGEAKDGGSFLCMIEQGAPYASIQADISGKNHSYNFVNSVYSLVHREQYDVGDRTTAAMFVYEDALPDEKLVQRYYFMDTDNYSEMADGYRNYLINKYDGYMTKNDDQNAPVEVEIVGAVDKIKQIAGIPVSSPLKLTSYKEATEIIQELSNEGMTNMSVKLSGWMNGGVRQQILKKAKPVSELGSKKDLKALVAKANELGVDVYLDGITNYAKHSDMFDGFMAYTDAAKFVSKEKVELYTYSTIDYSKKKRLETYFLLKGSLIPQMAQNLVDASNTYNAGVSFNDYGSKLSSDFNRKDFLSRQAAMVNQSEHIKSIKDSGKNIIINEGNDYAAPYSDLVTNMDLAGSEYTIIDKKVPFYQMALHGFVNYTGEALNLTQNPEDELLKSVEYGAGLSFTMMKASTFELQNTLYTEYFGANYDAWHQKAVDIYTRYNEEMGHVFNQMMTGHEYITDTLTCTTYEDGTRVYVNYGYSDTTTTDGKNVPARDYLVIK